MHRDSDARDYVTHSKAGWPIVELEGTMNMGNGGVGEKVWNGLQAGSSRVLHHWISAQRLLSKYVQTEYMHGWMKYQGTIWNPGNMRTYAKYLLCSVCREIISFPTHYTRFKRDWRKEFKKTCELKHVFIPELCRDCEDIASLEKGPKGLASDLPLAHPRVKLLPVGTGLLPHRWSIHIISGYHVGSENR